MTRPAEDATAAIFRTLFFLVFAAGLSPAANVHAQAEVAAPMAADAAAVPVEDDKSIKELWDQTLTLGDKAKIMASYDAVNAFEGGLRDLTAEQCKDHGAALDDAMKDNPVGLGVWYVGYRCAQLLGDEDAAARRLRRFEALVHYAFASVPPDFGITPIHVVSPIDVYAFIVASGQKMLYQYYDLYHVDRYLPLRVALWDAEQKRERWVAFDYIDAFARLSRDQKMYKFPYFRRSVADSILTRFAEDGEGAAREAVGIQKALGEKDRTRRLAILAEQAQGGSITAAMSLTNTCLYVRALHCESQAIDALLPFVESHYALAMTALAVFYADGLGMKRDDQAARKLIAAANERLGDSWGTFYFTALWTTLGKDFGDRLIKEQIDALAHSSNPMAQVFSVALTVQANKSLKLSDTERERLGKAAEKGLPLAQSLLGEVLVEQGKYAEGLVWIRRAAAADHPAAQTLLASKYARGWAQGQIDPDMNLAEHWYAEAGLGGDVQSMLWLGRHYLALPDSEENRADAKGWFFSANIKGSTDGALGLAQVYRRNKTGTEGTPKDAIAIYRELSETRDSAAARREWAEMLHAGDGVDKDIAEARRLLGVDANKGDAQSQQQLGVLLVYGDAGKELMPEGVDWLRKASAKGNLEAMDQLADVTYHGLGTAVDVKEGERLWEAAIAKGYTFASNNLAWVLCTSADDHRLDPKRGLALMKALGAESNMPLAFLDTISACHAALGDFDHAIEIEQRGLSLATTRNDARFIEHANNAIRDYQSHKRQIQ